jgi:hypothetical protein
MSFTPKGADGLTLAMGNEGGTCDAKLDGKSYPATGALWPAGWTCTVTRNGAKGLNLPGKRPARTCTSPQ